MEASMKSDLIDIEIYIVFELRLSWCVMPVDTAADSVVWVPKSQCEVERRDDSRFASMSLPESIALEKGLI